MLFSGKMMEEEIAEARGLVRDSPTSTLTTFKVLALVSLANQRDRLTDDLKAAREEAQARLDRSTDWYQQRFNRLRRWVDEEVRPLSDDVATRYHAICANGSPSPHESADWKNTMHEARVRAEVAESKARALEAENAEMAALLGRAIKYAREDEMTTPCFTRLARVLEEAERTLAVRATRTGGGK